MTEDKGPDGLTGYKTTRRSFLKGMGVAAGAGALLPRYSQAQETANEESSETPGLKELGRGKREIVLRLDGKRRKLSVEPRTTLLAAMREGLNETGPKEVCDRGSCGACTVMLDGSAVMSCMVLAMDAEGAEVLTAQGIAEDPRFKNLLDSFIENDAAQCGFCIPGFFVRSAAMLLENPKPTPSEIRHGIAGNICRCGTYSKMFDAIEGCVRKGGVG